MTVPHSFLAHVDLLGVTYSSPSIATGFGMHLAQPLLRKALDDLGPDGYKNLSEDEARNIMENAMRVLFYRDARSLNKVRRRASARCGRNAVGCRRSARCAVRADFLLCTSVYSSKSRRSRRRVS